MNTKQLYKTHKHLTIVFTMVILLLFIILGSIFLVAKYYNEDRQEKKQFLQQVTEISTLAKTGEHFFEGFKKLKEFHEGRNFGDIRKREGRNLIMEDISFIILDRNKNIIFQNIIKEPSFDTLDYSKQPYYTDDGTYIALRNIGDNWGVFYKEKKYDADDVISDTLLLLLLALIFGVVFYIVGYKLVYQALRPVAENMQDMSDFIHNAGHELKTPLAVMRGNLQVMKAEEKLDIKLLKKSIKQVDTMNALIEGLRELSEVGGLMEKQNLALSTEIARHVKELSSFASRQDVILHNHAQGPFSIIANPQELSVLLNNLIKNAIKYNVEGGEVHISLTKNILSISDTGIGISPVNQRKIFDRFYRVSSVRSQDSFGIGLSLVKKIADANAWKIQVESTEGKGSEFKVMF